jgi:hypothetical protein
MLEAALPGEDHRRATLVASLDDLVVAKRATGLYDARHTFLQPYVNTVAEGKEGIGYHYRAL